MTSERLPDPTVSDVLRTALDDYERRVEQMAFALHEDCVLRANAERAVNPVDDPWRGDRHDEKRHYGQAHDLVRRIFPELDAVKWGGPR